MEKDYYVKLKVQQGRLKSAMAEMNIRTARRLAEKTGSSQSDIGELLNFKKSPRRKDGTWRLVAVRIGEVLGYSPEELFPEHLDKEVLCNSVETFADERQLAGFSSSSPRQIGPREEADDAICKELIDGVLDTLTEREQEVIRLRFWENQTLEEVGRKLRVTRARVRSIESHALQKLRHKKRISVLEETCAHYGL